MSQVLQVQFEPANSVRMITGNQVNMPAGSGNASMVQAYTSGQVGAIQSKGIATRGMGCQGLQVNKSGVELQTICSPLKMDDTHQQA